jgi:hypothetical protein
MTNQFHCADVNSATAAWQIISFPTLCAEKAEIKRLLAAGETQPVEENLAAFLERFGDDAGACLFCASVRMRLNDLEGARHDLTRSINLGNKAAAAYASRAKTAELLGDYEAALKDLVIASRKLPDSLLFRESTARVERLWASTDRSVQVDCVQYANSWERQAAHRMKKALRGVVDGRLLAGLSLPDRKGGRINVDLLLVCDRGVFVLECKNYTGKIEGGANCGWLASKEGTSKKVGAHRGVNPLFQAEQQVYSMRARLEAWMKQQPKEEQTQYRVHGAVLFPDEAEFDLGSVATNRMEGNAIAVSHVRDLAACIRARRAIRQGALATREGRTKFAEWLKR